MNMKIFTKTCIASGLVLMLQTAAFADVQSSSSAEKAPAAPAKPSGLLPVPDYSGDLSERAYLMGDFDGKRSEWANNGITFDIDYYQYFQGVVDGGMETGNEYSGVVNLNMAIDFDKMGLIPGGLLQLQTVSRYGKSVNGISGAAIPVNADMTTPTTSDPDEDVFFYLPVINYTQFFSEEFAVVLGKYNTYPQAQEFAGASGKSQYWNLNLVAPVSPLLIVPYSTLLAAALYMPIPDLDIMVAVGTSTDTSNHSGFDYLDDGKFVLVKVIYEYEIGKLPGGFTHQYAYGWDNDFTEVNGGIDYGGEFEATTADSTWLYSFDFWQYLWAEGYTGQKIDVNNGEQDLQGVGIFSRIQFADKDTNPLDYMVSFGVNAKGLFPTRDNDTMGIAYNYTKLQDLRLGNIIGIDDTNSVWEAFYNFELTKAMHLTLNGQVVDGALPNSDTATILGTSLRIRF